MAGEVTLAAKIAPTCALIGGIRSSRVAGCTWIVFFAVRYCVSLAKVVPLFPVLCHFIPVSDLSDICCYLISPPFLSTMSWSGSDEFTKKQLFWESVVVHSCYMTKPSKALFS